MAHDIQIARRARSIFERLGYDVRTDDDPAEFRAERDWKRVTVRAVADPDDVTPEGGLCCYVTDDDTAGRLASRLDGIGCGECAVISVDGSDDYEVIRTPPFGR